MNDVKKKPELKALCMRDRGANNKPTMQVMIDIQVVETEGKGGSIRYSAKGKCTKCGGNMFKFLSKELADELRA